MGRAKLKDSRAPRVIAFAGPSLYGLEPAVRAEHLAGIELRPPGERGDVLAAVAEAPDVLVLLDGIYFTVPTITHKELLYALDSGVHVIGAASLGALRAAELEAFGMEGVGRVFEWFRDGVLDGDDEVAVLHAPADLGYRPLTVALVEVRSAVARLEAGGSVTPAAAAMLLSRVKALSFDRRSAGRIETLAREVLPEDGASRLARLLESPGLKRGDAVAALRQARRLGGGPDADGAVDRRPIVNVDTEFSAFFKESYLRPPGPRVSSEGPEAPEPPTLFEAWQAVQALHPGAPELVRRLRLRFLLASEAVYTGLDAAGEIPETPRGEAADGAVLPARELGAEARTRALAEAAVRHHGGATPALASLAARMGLDRAQQADSADGADGADGSVAAEGLLGLLAAQRSLVPAWSFARAFAASPLVDAGLAAASAAAEVHRCYERWRGERPTSPRALSEVAAGLWRCSPGEAIAEAARRDLFPASGFAPGLWEVIERLAPAERLARPINDYPRAKAALLACDLAVVCPPPSLGETPQEALTARTLRVSGARTPR